MRVRYLVIGISSVALVGATAIALSDASGFSTRSQPTAAARLIECDAGPCPSTCEGPPIPCRSLQTSASSPVRILRITISAQSLTVQTAPKVTRTLTLSDKTTYKQGGTAAHLADLKVGDRVVIDVPEHTTQALLIQIGAATAASAHK